MVTIHLHTIILNQSMFVSVHSKAILERFTTVTTDPVNCCLQKADHEEENSPAAPTGNSDYESVDPG